MPIRTYEVRHPISKYIANPMLNSVCVEDLEYFLFRVRPINVSPPEVRKRKENYSFSSANPLTDDRKLCTSHMRRYVGLPLF